MKREEIWIGVLLHTEERWKQFDYAKIFYNKSDAEQWAQSVKSYCAKTGALSYDRIYIGKIPTNFNYLRKEA